MNDSAIVESKLDALLSAIETLPGRIQIASSKSEDIREQRNWKPKASQAFRKLIEIKFKDKYPYL